MKTHGILDKIERALEKFIDKLIVHANETPGMSYAIFQGILWASLFFLITCIRRTFLS